MLSSMVMQAVEQMGTTASKWQFTYSAINI